MHIRALLVDDEPHARTTLRQLLAEYCPDTVIITGEAGTVEEACQLILTEVPDVLFLDMELDDRNGFDIIYALPPDRRSFMIVVVSGYEQYGVRAVNEGVEYYLLKPVDIDELRSIAEQLHRKLQHHSPVQSFDRNKEKSVLPARLYLSDGNGKKKTIPVESLMYCTPEGNYCRLHFRNAAPFVLYSSMKKLGAALPADSFIRIHHSCIVNIRYIHEYDSRGYVLLTDGTSLHVSRRHRKELLHMLQQHSLIG